MQARRHVCKCGRVWALAFNAGTHSFKGLDYQRLQGQDPHASESSKT